MSGLKFLTKALNEESVPNKPFGILGLSALVTKDLDVIKLPDYTAILATCSSGPFGASAFAILSPFCYWG